jgi:hypothetical protein
MLHHDSARKDLSKHIVTKRRESTPSGRDAVAARSARRSLTLKKTELTLRRTRCCGTLVGFDPRSFADWRFIPQE